MLLAVLLLITACRKNEELRPQNTSDLLTPAEIDARLEAALQERGRIYWSDQDLHTRYSAAMQSDSLFAVGYQPENFSNIETRIHQLDLQSEEWAEAKDRLFDLIEGSEGVAIEQLLPYGEPEVVPNFAVRITKKSTLEALQQVPGIRFLEPMGYYPQEGKNAQERDAGCGISPNYNIPASDYTTIAPGAKRPWNFDLANIPAAWTQTSGAGVKITIIDTGASDNQNNLGSQFNSGYSGGRTIEKLSTHYSGWWWWRSLDSPNDPCGHGTQMAGLAAGPRSNDGNSTGVAYNADLMSIRAVADVVISSSDEKQGVKNALIIAGNDSDVRVISMSIGTPFYSGTVADGIYYAYNQGKMIMAAAGTSTSWTNWYGVIFPAWMPQTVAITGVRDQSPYEECSTCHYGAEVDFVCIMQRDYNDNTSLSLALCCDQPGYVGGSSAATATTAGIAALVWSQNPAAPRATILQVLKNASALYPAKDNNFGYGTIDANLAVNDPAL
jgi:subtilisin family serine protease